MTIQSAKTWNIRELEEAEQDGRIEMLDVPRLEARRLVDEMPEGEWADDLIGQLDESQGDSTDGRPRYIVLRILSEL